MVAPATSRCMKEPGSNWLPQVLPGAASFHVHARNAASIAASCTDQRNTAARTYSAIGTADWWQFVTAMCFGMSDSEASS